MRAEPGPRVIDSEHLWVPDIRCTNSGMTIASYAACEAAGSVSTE
jgi:hypothetical protein